MTGPSGRHPDCRRASTKPRDPKGPHHASPNEEPRHHSPRGAAGAACPRQGHPPGRYALHTRKLVHLRASQINGCSVCVDMHAALARRRARPTSASSPSPPGATRRTSPSRTRRARAHRGRHPAHRPAGPGARRDLGGRRRPLRRADLAALIVSIAQINVWNRLNVSVKMVAGAAWS